MTSPEVCENIAELSNLVAIFPPLNRRVFKYLIKFLQLVGNPENEPFTKMGYRNLATVWSPGLFKCSIDDPVLRMQCTKYETQAIHTLLVGFQAF